MQPTTAPQQHPQATAFEHAIPVEERLRNGQYYTPASVCDFMLALSMPPSFSPSVSPSPGQKPFRVLEPGCGPGSFLLRLTDWLNARSRQQQAVLPVELCGIELEPQAAKLAQSLLNESHGTGNAAIYTMNFISPEADQLGEFDWIIGNPPYVRQEHLAQSQQVDKKAMQRYLQQKYADYLASYPAQKALFEQTADLYLWFFLQATSLLKPGGRLAFITSNSWLNTAYGQHFQQFLIHHFNVLSLAESACERWFGDAAINPLIVVLEKQSPPVEKQPEKYRSADGHFTNSGQINPVFLVRLLVSLERFLPDTQQADYWSQLTQKTQQIPQNNLKGELQVNQFQTEQLQGSPFQNNWALPLRAPAELTDLLSQPLFWQKLEALGQVRYPLKTGINAFFYLSREQAEQWRIEPEFLLPVLRSSRQVKGYVVQAQALQEFLFSCPYTTTELAERGQTGALAYIQWGEAQTSPPRQKRAQTVPWPQVPSVKSNRPWHYTRPLPPAHLLCPRFIDQRFFFPLCQGPVMEDQTFYGLTIAQPAHYPPELLAALLNSTPSYLLAEFSGRSNLGEGVLQFARCDMAGFSIVNPDLFLEEEKDNLMAAFGRLSNRPILPLAQELFSPDRVALDELILTPIVQIMATNEPVAALRERLAQQLLARVSERRNLANSTRRKPTLR